MTELSWLPEPLHPVAYRIARADELCYQLGLESFQWSRSKPLELARCRKSGMEQLVVTGIRPVPPRISMMFSEAVNHLRAAIDNAVFHLAGQTEEGPLTAKQEKAVSFPIYGDGDKYEEWRKDTRRKVPQLTPGVLLGDRIRSLQPFASAGRAIASVEPRVAYMNGMEVHREHPLLLLQEYSNTDKHRALRVAVHRSLELVRGSSPAGDTRSMRTIEVGDVLVSTRIGTPVFAEHGPFAGIERPGTEDVVVNPGRELDALICYVARTAVPTLVTGEHLDEGLPPHLDLDDTGATTLQRLETAGYVSAHQRIQPVIAAGLREADDQPLYIPPLMD